MNLDDDFSVIFILRWSKELEQQALTAIQRVEAAAVNEQRCYRDQADAYLEGAKLLESKLSEVHTLKREVEQMKKVLNVEKQRQDRMEQAVEALRCTVKKKQEQVETHKAAVAVQRLANEGVEECKEGIALFRDWAGFSITAGRGKQIKFSFTLLDLDDPAKESSFVIGVEDGIYKAVKCSPPVPQFDGLVQQLNGDRCIDRLVKSMRRAFVGLIATGDR